MNNDLISRQTAIDALDEVSKHYTEKGREWHPHVDLMIYAIKELPSAQQWITCKERLPDEDRNVLLSVHFLGLEIKHKTGWNDHIKESWYVDVACQIGGEWSSASDEYKVAKNRHIVTAWMPLPEPWRGEEG